MFRHFQTATSHLGWDLHHFNGGNKLALIKARIAKASPEFDALVLGGIALSSVEQEIKQLNQQGVIVVGWHAVAKPGPVEHLFTNISTKSDDVAGMAVDYITDNARQKMGIVILNDPRFEVANAKTNEMLRLIDLCQLCELLEVVEMDLGEANTLMPKLVIELNASHGKLWTHTLAINDSYYDSVNYPLRQLQRGDIKNIAAGDGSFLAFSRIKSGLSQQVATVAEPFAIQGWQLADELNRAFAGVPATKFVPEPVLVTHEKLINNTELREVVEHSDYQQKYLSMWFKDKH